MFSQNLLSLSMICILNMVPYWLDLHTLFFDGNLTKKKHLCNPFFTASFSISVHGFLIPFWGGVSFTNATFHMLLFLIFRIRIFWGVIRWFCCYLAESVRSYFIITGILLFIIILITRLFSIWLISTPEKTIFLFGPEFSIFVPCIISTPSYGF